MQQTLEQPGPAQTSESATVISLSCKPLEKSNVHSSSGDSQTTALSLSPKGIRSSGNLSQCKEHGPVEFAHLRPSEFCKQTALHVKIPSELITAPSEDPVPLNLTTRRKSPENQEDESKSVNEKLDPQDSRQVFPYFVTISTDQIQNSKVQNDHHKPKWKEQIKGAYRKRKISEENLAAPRRSKRLLRRKIISQSSNPTSTVVPLNLCTKQPQQESIVENKKYNFLQQVYQRQYKRRKKLQQEYQQQENKRQPLKDQGLELVADYSRAEAMMYNVQVGVEHHEFKAEQEYFQLDREDADLEICDPVRHFEMLTPHQRRRKYQILLLTFFHSRYCLKFPGRSCGIRDCKHMASLLYHKSTCHTTDGPCPWLLCGTMNIVVYHWQTCFIRRCHLCYPLNAINAVDNQYHPLFQTVVSILLHRLTLYKPLLCMVLFGIPDIRYTSCMRHGRRCAPVQADNQDEDYVPQNIVSICERRGSMYCAPFRYTRERAAMVLFKMEKDLKEQAERYLSTVASYEKILSPTRYRDLLTDMKNYCDPNYTLRARDVIDHSQLFPRWSPHYLSSMGKAHYSLLKAYCSSYDLDLCT